MSSAEYKANIAALIEQIEDQSILANVLNYLKRVGSTTAPTEKLKLSKEQKLALDEGLSSISSQGTISHDDVMAEMKQKFPSLYK